MMCRYGSSQKGFGLVKALGWIVLIGLVLYFLPSLLSRVENPIATELVGTLDELKLSANNLLGRVSGGFRSLKESLADQKLGIEEKVLIFKERILAKYGRGEGSRGMDWDRDMQELLKRAKKDGFTLPRSSELFDKYRAGEARQITVEKEFWKEMRKETEDSIERNSKFLGQRALGCGNFTYEFQLLRYMRDQFNEDSFVGYVTARQSAELLGFPRSKEFLEEFLARLVVASGYTQSFGWFAGKLEQAINEVSGRAMYPQIIKEINARISTTRNPFEQVVGNITIAEICLNYNLINPAEARFDEAIRIFSEEIVRYQNTRAPRMVLGTHMAAGLLHQRVCKNGGLAIKEFKDVIGIARRVGFDVEYSIAHFNLGMLYLYFKDQMKVEFKNAAPGAAVPKRKTAAPVPKATAAPTTPTPISTPTAKPIDINIEISIPRSLDEQGRPERPAAGGTPLVAVTPTVPPTPKPTPRPTPTPTPRPAPPSGLDVLKGTVVVPRMERPKPDLGETRKMGEIDIGNIFDLSSIPADANRQFELYLKFVSEGPEADVARLIHQKYLGN